MSEQKNLKPSERLEVIERQLLNTQKRVGELELLLFSVSRESDALKEISQLINQRLNAATVLLERHNILTNNDIEELIVAEKENTLKERVQMMLDKGDIVPTEEIGDASFVVSRELNKEGKVENPRLQFVIPALSDELKEKFLGKKTGELVKTGEDKLDIEIMEIYNPVMSTQNATPAEVNVSAEGN